MKAAEPPEKDPGRWLKEDLRYGLHTVWAIKSLKSVQVYCWSPRRSCAYKARRLDHRYCQEWYEQTRNGKVLYVTGSRRALYCVFCLVPAEGKEISKSTGRELSQYFAWRLGTGELSTSWIPRKTPGKTMLSARRSWRRQLPAHRPVTARIARAPAWADVRLNRRKSWSGWPKILGKRTSQNDGLKKVRALPVFSKSNF